MRRPSLVERWTAHKELVLISLGELPLSSEGRFIMAAMEMLMATLDDVLAKVQEAHTVEQGLTELLDGLVDERDALRAKVVELQSELDAAGLDQTKVQAILDQLDSDESLLNASRRRITTAVTMPPPADAPTNEVPPADTSAPADTPPTGAGDDTIFGGNGGDSGSASAGDPNAPVEGPASPPPSDAPVDPSQAPPTDGEATPPPSGDPVTTAPDGNPVDTSAEADLAAAATLTPPKKGPKLG